MVYIASHNIITSLGFTTEENFEKIQAGQTGISQSGSELSPEKAAVSITDSKLLEKCFIKKNKAPENFTRYEKLLICSISKALENTEIRLNSPDTLLIISTTKGNVNLRAKEYQDNYNSDRLHLWRSSEIAAAFFGHKSKAITISNACISGALALISAQRMIEAGEYKHAVVAGADILTEFTLSGFLAFKAVSPEACRPFDENRLGMTPGEGAGCLILTSEKELAPPNAVLLAGGASSNDANHISGPSRTGAELATAISRAMVEADISSEKINYISAHGTATPYNDEMESKALALSGLQNVPVNSYKGNIGHTFGAAGIIETILAAESMRHNRLLPSFGYEKQGTSHKLSIIRQADNAEINYALKTASGFGGCNAALILAKENKPSRLSEKSEIRIEKTVGINNFEVFENKEKRTFDFYETINQADSFTQKFKVFSKSLYKSLGCKYPKFYKMDNLCKLAFLGAELLLKEGNHQQCAPEDVAVILSNGSGSSDTDAEYQKTIDERDNYFPSPKIFVYTLANIMSGEISIRHGLKGENCIFIEEKFDKEFCFNYARILISQKKAKVVITGRVNFDSHQKDSQLELYYLTEMKKSLQ